MGVMEVARWTSVTMCYLIAAYVTPATREKLVPGDGAALFLESAGIPPYVKDQIGLEAPALAPSECGASNFFHIE